jgi:hypothetical protein
VTDRDLTGYCGLYCGDCGRYMSRVCELAHDLLEEFEKTQFSEYADVKQYQISDFEHYDQTVSLLTHIAHLRCETPCRLGGDGCIGHCPIIECVKDNSFEGCWECPTYKTCEKFDSLKPFSGDIPLHKLDKINEFGLDSWARHRGKFYKWQK